MRFKTGLMTGAIIGVAVSAIALNSMRPDVTAKMLRNGRKVVNRYKKQMCLD